MTKYYDIPTDPYVRKLAEDVYKLFEVYSTLLFSSSRIKAHAMARQYLCQKLTDTGSYKIKDLQNIFHWPHTTVIYARKPENRKRVYEYLYEKKKVKRFINYKTGEMIYERISGNF